MMESSDANSKALIAALQAYQDEDQLTKEQRSAARMQSTQDFLDGIDPGLLSLKDKDCSRIKNSMEHMRPFMDALTHLAPGMDVFANADPHGLLSLIWGSIRMVLIVAHDYQNFLDDIVNLFMDVKPDIERLKLYLSTFRQNKRLQNSLSIVYCEIMLMCSWLRSFFQSSRTRRLVKHVLTPTALKSDAQSYISKIKNACKDAESDAYQAHAQANMEAHKQVQGQNDQLFQKLSKLELDNDARTARDEAQQASSLLRGLGKWLDPIPMDDELERRKRDILAGTCAWIEQYQSVSTWLWDGSKTRSGAVWITAQPGYANPAHSTALNVLRTLAWQMLQQCKDLAHLLQADWETGAKLSLTTIRKVLDILLESRQSVNVLIDGIDECSMAERKILLTHIRHLSTQANVVLLSRPETDIITSIKAQPANNLLQHIELSPAENLVDIKKFTWSQVRALELDVDVDTQRTIIDNIWGRADGMFLWVRLVVDELEAQKYFQYGELDSLLEVVASFPAGLEAAYTRAADLISDQRSVLREAIRLLLTWIMFARRPLTIHELESATTYQLSLGRPKPQPIRVSSLLRDFCRSFVTVDTVTNRVRAIHETAAYFLVSSSQAGELSLDPVAANTSLASACVGISTSILASLPPEAHINNASENYNGPKTRQLYDALKVDSTFLEYATIAWALHANSASTGAGPADGDTMNSLCWIQNMDRASSEPLIKLLSSELMIIRWIRLICCYRMDRRPLIESLLDVLHHWTDTTSSDDILLEGEPVPGHSSSLEAWLTRLISHIGKALGNRVHRLHKFMDWHQRFPVQYFELNHLYTAAFFNYSVEIKRLVETGANVNLQIGVSTALIYAACGESPSAIEQLLDEGVNVNVISPREDDSALSRSFESVPSDEPGEYAAANTLLRRGAKLHPPRSPSNVFAFLCASNNLLEFRLAALHRLFETATDSDLEYSGRTFGWLPLHEVVHRNEPKMVEALLKHHSNPARYASITTEDTGKTPLHIACEKDHSKVVDVLLRYAKSSVNSQNPYTGSIALHVAAAYKSDALATLLENGAAIDIADGQGRTALHVAARADWVEGVQMLLKSGAILDVKDSSGRTAAALAHERGSKRTASILHQSAKISNSPIDRPSESVVPHVVDASNIEVTGRAIRYLLLKSKPNRRHNYRTSDTR